MITFDTFYTIQRVSGLSQDDKPLGMKPGSIFMELDTGKTFIFDGETWHEQPNGGGWPADLPKPSVGGYGYTESGVETILVDNEIVTTVNDSLFILGEFKTPFNIVDGAYTVIFNGTEYNLNSTLDGKGDFWYLGGDFSQYPFKIEPPKYGRKGLLYTESAGDYEITVKTITDTIRTIDEKYLPVIPAAPSNDGVYALVCTVTGGEPAYSWLNPKSI